MDDRHFRSVVRAALRADGFNVSAAELAAADRRSRVVGLRLRDVLVERLPGFAARTDVLRLAEADSFTWGRLPGMLAFGHQQAVVFRRVLHPGKRSLPAAALLPVAAFSAGISLLDYLADAAGMAEPIFEVLDEPTVAGLFRTGPAAGARLAEAYGQTGDARLRLLFALVAVCGTGLAALHRRHGGDERWRDLQNTFVLLHAAQKDVTFPNSNQVPGLARADAVSTKSVLPFVAACQMAELFDPPGNSENSARELARQIGATVALTDDLIDLQADWQSGAPNTYLSSLGAADGRPGGQLADAWLYRVARQGAAQIMAALRSAALLDEPAQPPVARPPGRAAAARFATLTVARWTGWREEFAPPSVFASRRPRRARPETGPREAAVTMLLAQQRTGYEEAVHWMTVPRLDGGAVRLEAHPGTVFQRAIVLDSLLDAYAAGLAVPARLLAAEALLVLGEKRDDAGGGWSYLPGVPELPPDADDLAMVLQVLSRSGGQELAAAGRPALTLVQSAADRGAAMSTWVLDPRDGAARNNLFRRYIELTRADGVHPDVVANLLYAASLAGAKASGQFPGAISYLESAQNDDGSWPSRWYWGSHYGTYRAVLALTAIAPDSGALDRASDYLAAGQHENGGWGDSDGSDPLSTAFAVLALAALAPRRDGRPRRRALDYLIATQQPDGGWPGCPFIAFPQVGGSGMHIYRSRTITTSFCLKAMLAVSSSGRLPARRPRATAIAWPPASGPPTAADWS